MENLSDYSLVITDSTLSVDKTLLTALGIPGNGGQDDFKVISDSFCDPVYVLVIKYQDRYWRTTYTGDGVWQDIDISGSTVNFQEVFPFEEVLINYKGA